ncbi:NAD-dependent epimerase/dehydratase [Caballeronia terrestris]|uniref:NAD-dependent epimerase/dehydratase n=1 Tax=Caballeronia terrestris TaxID=1226301 RepID=A0A158F8J9_9BURK|nr:NAD-dependent epimerase/dehydratase family protein [Caballeronia terrestris]SAL16186.1 NAD-dependent epimerase/dehydratase [Caballeronia terrestris]
MVTDMHPMPQTTDRKTFFVTGASGFIGTALVRRLRANGHNVRCAVRSATGDASEIECRLDSSPETWVAALSGVDGVFHLAWSTSPRSANASPLADLTTNLVGTVGLLEAMRVSASGPIVLASSGGTVYGAPTRLPVSENHALNPLGVYGASKVSAETYAMVYRRQFGIDARILRFSNPYGPGQNVDGQLGAASIFAYRALSNLPINIWGDGFVVRDYVYIEDTIDAMLATMSAARETFRDIDPIINIGSGQGVSLRKIIQVIEEILARPVEVNYQPARAFDVPVSVLDVSLAKHLLNWHPKTSFEFGMQRTLRHLMLTSSSMPPVPSVQHTLSHMTSLFQNDIAKERSS